MKKIILTLAIMLLAASASFSQKWLPQAPIVSGNQAMIYGKWIKVYDKETKTYGTFFFRKNSPVGLKDIVSKVVTLLDEAGGDWDETLVNDELFPSFCNGITDYQNLYLGLETETAQVYKLWTIGSYAMSMSMKKDYSVIYIRKL